MIDREKFERFRAISVVAILCKIINDADEGGVGELQTLFNLSITNGFHQVVEEMLNVAPERLVYVNKDEKLKPPILVAAEHRDERSFRILFPKFKSHLTKMAKGSSQNLKRSMKEYERLIQTIAKTPQIRLEGTGPKVMLQMQHELHWYKEAEKLVPPQCILETEHAKAPLDVFVEEHKEMMKSDEEWVMSLSNSCIVGASLVATVVFAAAITVPGGNDVNGLPNFYKDNAFKIFAFSNSFALISSITTILVFLSIFSNRSSANDFLFNLPNRLIIGLISLLLSLTFLMIAFGSIVHLVFGEHYPGIVYPTFTAFLIPFILFLYLQLPSLIFMMKSTYGGGILQLSE